MSKLRVKLNNFERALHKLNQAIKALQLDSDNDVIRDGVIQRFEFTYELCWKTAKQYLEDIGLTDRNSPRAVFKEAYAQKLIGNEDNWLIILRDRNLTSHVYSEEMAIEIAHRIVNCHAKEFASLLSRIKANIPL